MAVARFMRLSLDANDLEVAGRFWSRTLSLSYRADANYPGGDVIDDDRRTGLRLERVADTKTVKNRVHPDIYVGSLRELTKIGATIVRPEGDDRRWTVLADVEGNEFCAFLRDPVPEPVLHGVGIDCAEPRQLAAWWGDILGSPVTHNERGFSTVEASKDRPFTLDFDAVPEPKTVKNRMHWDVRAESVTVLLDRGASLLRKPHDESYWYVLADPEGNEFCAFPPV